MFMGIRKLKIQNLISMRGVRIALSEVAFEVKMHRVCLVAPGKWMLCASFVLLVLMMEYVPGIKINSVDALDQLGVDQKRLARYAMELMLSRCYLMDFSMLIQFYRR